MENASKALIIAGAILLAILIIALGVFVFGGVRDKTNTNQINTQQVRSVNSQFENYFGNNVNGSDAINLVETVRSYNLGLDDQVGPESVFVTFTATGAAAVNTNTAGGLNGISANINANARYTITSNDYSADTGYVRTITITQN